MTLTWTQYERERKEPPLCDQLPVRDYIDNVVVRTNGAFVAGYELRGLMSYFASDSQRNRSKYLLEALLRTIPEQSMRVQVRYEVVQDLGGLLEQYALTQRSEKPEVKTIDEVRVASLRGKEAQGQFLRPILHIYFLWDSAIHHRVSGGAKPAAPSLSPSPRKCIERSRQEHQELLAEFESVLRGIESTMQAAELGPRRLSEDELFLEAKRALNPLQPDRRGYRKSGDCPEFQSARDQITDVSILDESDTYLNVDGILYSFVSLKELPDATFPGILRELVSLDFPIVVNAQITIPDQNRVLKNYKSRLRKMQAAQRDTHGGFRANVEAQVAESQLLRVQQDIIASSLKTAKLSLIVGTRTSCPATTLSDLEQAERIIRDRRQQLLSTIARMNGAKAIVETHAKRRLFFSSLPAMAEEDLRDHDMLTPNAADLLPIEAPWSGTPRSPLFLLETPYRQLIPFSPFDPGLTDANALIMAKSGGGKSFMVQQLLGMAARDNPLVSIIERGDSYRALVELLGGQMLTMSLDGVHTINPWDLPQGEREPSKDQVSFLKNLTRHMLGENADQDAELLDNLLSEAIWRTYKRAAVRPSNPIPCTSDLRDELAQWRDPEKSERVMEAAKLAAIKLRSWTGEQGVYASLFDRPTTISLDNPWLFFNVEQLSDDPRLEAAMSLLIAYATSQRASGKSGKRSITVLDEFWYMLSSPVLAPVVVQLYRTARKRNGAIWGISQTAEDFVGAGAQANLHGAAILKNCSVKIVGQQPGDSTALRDHLFLNDVALHQIKLFGAPVKGKSADALIVIGEKADTTHTIRMAPTPIEYWIFTTYPRERAYRKWFMNGRKSLPLISIYQELADKFPQGLADVQALPEEITGEVARVGAKSL